LPRYINLSCGFDVLGLCLETAGDEMIIGNQLKKDSITKIVGADLPLETEKMWLEYLL
jgi:homoserine kinase